MSAAISLLSELRNRGVYISKQGDQLSLSAPPGVIDGNLALQIKEQKSEILSVLEAEQVSIVVIQSRDDLRLMEEALFTEPRPSRVFLDTETSPYGSGLPAWQKNKHSARSPGLDPFYSKLVTVQVLAGDTCYILRPDLIGQTPADDPFAWACLERLLMDPDISKVGHNLKFDLSMVIHHIFRGKEPWIRNLYDTYLAECLLTAGKEDSAGSEGNGGHGSRSLAALHEKYLGKALPKDEQTGFRACEPLTAEQIEYAVNDVTCLDEIMTAQQKLLEAEALTETARLEFDIIPAVAMMELSGMRVDRARLATLTERLKAERDQAERHVLEITGVQRSHPPVQEEPPQPDCLPGVEPGTKKRKAKNPAARAAFNPASPQQVKAHLATLGFKVSSTDERNLKKIDHPFAKAILDFRSKEKLFTTYIEPLPGHIHEDGRVRPEFNQVGSEAGRFSCSRPNLQNIPRSNEFRALFIARPEHLILTADYSSIEMRILAELSQDPTLLKAFNSPGPHKFFEVLAGHLYGIDPGTVTKDQYSDTKTLCYGLNYGQGAVGLAERKGIPTDEAQALIDRFFKMFPRIKKTLTGLGMTPLRTGCTTTLLGRKRYFPKPKNHSQRHFIERQGRNTPIQGTAGDVFKCALYLVHNKMPVFEGRVVNVVHDELVIEVPEEHVEEAEQAVKDLMIQAGQRFLKTVPIEVDVKTGTTWRK